MTKKTKSPAADVVVFEKGTVLNKADREDFVDSVMADVPKIDYCNMIESEARKDLESQLPAEIKKLMKSELSKYLGKSYISVTNYRELEGVGSISIQTAAQHEKFSQEFRTRRAELMKLHNAQYETRSNLKTQLRATAEMCRTDKQLAERLPEFSKYIPKKGGAVTTANLPALANLVADFTKAGWPKDKKAKA